MREYSALHVVVSERSMFSSITNCAANEAKNQYYIDLRREKTIEERHINLKRGKISIFTGAYYCHRRTALVKIKKLK